MRGSSTHLDGFELLADTLGEMVSRHDADGHYTYASAGTRAPARLRARGADRALRATSSSIPTTSTTCAAPTPPCSRATTGSTSATATAVRTAPTSSARRSPGRSATTDDEIAELIVVKRDVGDAVAGDTLRRQWEICFKRTSRGISVVDAEHRHDRLAQPGAGRDARRHRRRLRRQTAAHPLHPGVGGADPRRPRTVDKNTFVSYDSDHVRLDGSVFPVRAEVMAARDERGDGPVPDRLVRRPHRAPGGGAAGRARCSATSRPPSTPRRTGSRSSASTAASSTSTRSSPRSSATRSRS